MTLMWVVIMTFITSMAVVLIPPLMQRIATAVHCPGAVEVISDTQRSGSIGIQGGGTMATSTTSLLCVFADGTEKTIDNDPMFITAMGMALVVGVVAGVIIALFSRFARRMRVTQP